MNISDSDLEKVLRKLRGLAWWQLAPLFVVGMMAFFGAVALGIEALMADTTALKLFSWGIALLLLLITVASLMGFFFFHHITVKDNERLSTALTQNAWMWRLFIIAFSIAAIIAIAALFLGFDPDTL